MCRFAAYLGAPLDARSLVFGGDHSLFEQSWAPRELLSGSVNADGYGVVWYDGGRPARRADPRPIWHDEDLPRALETVRSHCLVAALRNTTPGLPVDRSGLLPMVHDRWTFVLNGFVPDFRRSHMRSLRAELPDDLYGALTGSSDSETLFLMAVAAVREGATLPEALERVARAVGSRVGREEAQLNLLLTDGEVLAVGRASTVLMTNSLYVCRHLPGAPEGVVLASERIDGGGLWEPVDGHSWLELSRDGAIRTDFLEMR